MKKFTTKQEAFCHEYLIDSNGAQSAIRAGYSRKGADVRAAQLLGNDRVQEYLSKLREKTRSKKILTAIEIQEMLSAKAIEDMDNLGLKALEMLNKMCGNYEADNNQKNSGIVILGDAKEFD